MEVEIKLSADKATPGTWRALTVPGDTEKSLSVNVLFIMLGLRVVVVVIVVSSARRTGPQRAPRMFFPAQKIVQHLHSPFFR